MRIFALVLALALAIVAPAFAVEDPGYDTKKYCKEVGDIAGGSSQLELSCRQMEERTKKNLANIQASARSAKHCADVGKIAGGSYQLFEACLQQEAEAEKELAK
jgi:hypothetical protein